MKIKQLRNIIENLDDEVDVVVPSAYTCKLNFATASISTALDDGSSEELTEDMGEELTPEAEYGKRTKVLFIY